MDKWLKERSGITIIKSSGITIIMSVCVDCNVEKPLTDFRAYDKCCYKCRYIRYKDKPRKHVKVVRPNCNQDRDVRIDAYTQRKTNMCIKCSPLFNEQ